MTFTLCLIHVFSVSQVLSFGLLIVAVVIYVALVITKLVLYSKFSDLPCTIESNVKTYLIISGVLEIVWPFLFILVIFCCKDEDFATTITTYQHWIKHPGGAWQKNGQTEEKSRGKSFTPTILDNLLYHKASVL